LEIAVDMRFTPLTSLVFLLIDQRTAVVEATYTIAATDSVTRQIGAAGGTCVEGSSLYEMNYHGVPNHGVLLTQALPPSPESPVYDLGEALLLNSTDPEVIIEEITDPLLDKDNNLLVKLLNFLGFFLGNATYDYHQLRQYGCVDLMGRAAGYEDPTLKEFYYDTGDIDEMGGGSLFNYTQNHMTGTIDTFAYSAQANICTQNTVSTLVDNFVQGNSAGGPCDLADRLYHAISAPTLMLREAMRTNDTSLMAGDVRCFGNSFGGNTGPNPQTALTMYLHVDNPDGSELVHIDIVNPTDNPYADPFIAFEQSYKAWRSNATACSEMPTGLTASGGNSVKHYIRSVFYYILICACVVFM
jgi:hypothetical protein